MARSAALLWQALLILQLPLPNMARAAALFWQALFWCGIGMVGVAAHGNAANSDILSVAAERPWYVACSGGLTMLAFFRLSACALRDPNLTANVHSAASILRARPHAPCGI